MNVDIAISDLKLQGIDVQEIDSLNFLLIQGDPNAAIEIKRTSKEIGSSLEADIKVYLGEDYLQHTKDVNL